MTDKLRDQLIGCLGACLLCGETTERSPSELPMGEKPTGIIMYTPDGYMSAQLMRANPGHFASGDWFKATPEEHARVASTYFAYAEAGPGDLAFSRCLVGPSLIGSQLQQFTEPSSAWASV
jgi:hypothetical protein